MKNKDKNQIKLEELRAKDFTKLITTPVRLVYGKKQALCPFHQESTPSFFVYSDNSYYCFGCGAHGRNAIDFVINKFSCSFEQACQLLEEI